jgi:hypothetical protein
MRQSPGLVKSTVRDLGHLWCSGASWLEPSNITYQGRCRHPGMGGPTLDPSQRISLPKKFHVLQSTSPATDSTKRCAASIAERALARHSCAGTGLVIGNGFEMVGAVKKCWRRPVETWLVLSQLL